jgi:D-glycero-alpha-D-manno-heptose-7-phosphate kinase
MVISRTPYRISFFGGGTDYPGWFKENGGAVLGTAIDKYCYISCRYLPPFFEHRIRVAYSKVEECKTVNEVKHPVVREVIRMLGPDRPLEVHHDGDLPARSGMGSSSAFTVGFLHSLNALYGQYISRDYLASTAIHVEQNILKETVGCQDQVFAAFGGFNFIEFNRDGSFRVEPLPVGTSRLKQLNDSLMLFYTGLRRTASEVAATYVEDIGSRAKQLHRMRKMVDEGIRILTGEGSLDAFGDLMHECWQQKRSLSGVVTNSEIDRIYDEARRGGALGGKLLGAGGGGFMLFFVPPEKRQAVRQQLSDLLWVPFRFDTGGSQIIFYSPEQDYAELESAEGDKSTRMFREAFGEPAFQRK